MYRHSYNPKHPTLLHHERDLILFLGMLFIMIAAGVGVAIYFLETKKKHKPIIENGDFSEGTKSWSIQFTTANATPFIGLLKGSRAFFSALPPPLFYNKGTVLKVFFLGAKWGPSLNGIPIVDLDYKTFKVTENAGGSLIFNAPTPATVSTQQTAAPGNPFALQFNAVDEKSYQSNYKGWSINQKIREASCLGAKNTNLVVKGTVFGQNGPSPNELTGYAGKTLQITFDITGYTSGSVVVATGKALSTTPTTPKFSAKGPVVTQLRLDPTHPELGFISESFNGSIANVVVTPL